MPSSQLNVRETRNLTDFLPPMGKTASCRLSTPQENASRSTPPPTRVEYLPAFIPPICTRIYKKEYPGYHSPLVRPRHSHSARDYNPHVLRVLSLLEAQRRRDAFSPSLAADADFSSERPSLLHHTNPAFPSSSPHTLVCQLASHNIPRTISVGWSVGLSLRYVRCVPFTNTRALPLSLSLLLSLRGALSLSLSPSLSLSLCARARSASSRLWVRLETTIKFPWNSINILIKYK